MANAQRGEVDLTVDGTVYVLRLSTNAQANLESMFGGEPFGEIMTRMDRGSVSVMRATLFVALREKQPLLTIDDAGEMVGRDRAGVVDAIGAALVLAYPEVTKGNPQQASDGAGTTS